MLSTSFSFKKLSLVACNTTSVLPSSCVGRTLRGSAGGIAHRNLRENDSLFLVAEDAHTLSSWTLSFIYNQPKPFLDYHSYNGNFLFIENWRNPI